MAHLVRLLAAALLLGGCSLMMDSATQCTTNADCTGEAICSEGLCLVPEPAGLDASVPEADAGLPDAGPVVPTVLSVAVNGEPIAGVPVSVTVAALDGQGRRATGFTGTVKLSSTDPAATLPAEHAYLAAEQGSYTFAGVVLRGVGPQSLTATATGLTGTAEVVVSAGPAVRLELTGLPASLAAGEKATLTVKALDALGNPVAAYRGTVRFASDDPRAVLPASYEFTAADQGVHEFADLELRSVGTRAVSAADLARPSINGKQAGVAVGAGPVAALRVSGVPSPVPAGLPVSVTVAAVDAFGNAAAGYAGQVRFTSDCAGAQLPADSQFLAGDGGTKTFAGLVLKAAPAVCRVTATDLGNAAISGAQLGVDVRVGPPAQLAFEAAPAAAQQVGAALGPTVKVVARDLGGNKVSSFADPVVASLAAGPDGAALSGTLAVPAVDGVATFADLRVDLPGTGYKLKAGSGSLAPAVADFAATACDPGYTGPGCADCLPGYGHPAGAPATCVDACQLASRCTQLPEATCDGNARLTYEASGAACAPTATGPDYFRCTYAPTRTPCGAAEICVDGACLPPPSPNAQQLLITEVMAAPSAGGSQWFEVKVLAPHKVSLSGLRIREANSGESFVVPATPALVVEPGGYVVFAASADPLVNGGLPRVDLAWSAPFALPANGRLAIQRGPVEMPETLVELGWTPEFPSAAGSSMALARAISAKGAADHAWWWCSAATAYGTAGDKGTPGSDNDTCGLPASPAIAWCNAQHIPAGSHASAATSAYGRLFIDGLTTRNTAGNDLYPYLVAEVGFGGANATDGTAFSWSPAAPNPGWQPTSAPSTNNDEFLGAVVFPIAGSFSWGYRFALVDPATGARGAWTYCNEQGPVETPANATWPSATIEP